MKNGGRKQELPKEPDRWGLEFMQDTLRVWREKNFPDSLAEETREVHAVLGACEEVGELCHVVLKTRQKIRGYDNKEKSTREKRDAIGDICIYLMGVCDANNFSLREIIQETAQHVMKRNWTKNKLNGKES